MFWYPTNRFLKEHFIGPKRLSLWLTMWSYLSSSTRHARAPFTRAAFLSVWKSATSLVRHRPATCQHPLRLTLRRRRRRRSRSQSQEEAEYHLVLKPECGGTHPWGALWGASVDDRAVSPAAASPRWQGGSCQEVSAVGRRRKPAWLHPSAAKSHVRIYSTAISLPFCTSLKSLLNKLMAGYQERSVKVKFCDSEGAAVLPQWYRQIPKLPPFSPSSLHLSIPVL